jgi:hypothetical protein
MRIKIKPFTTQCGQVFGSNEKLIFLKKKRSKKRKRKGMGFAHELFIRFAEALDQSIYSDLIP